MTEVAELLENIGAGELPTRIELPKHVNGAAHFGSILERLESEIDHVNVCQTSAAETSKLTE